MESTDQGTEIVSTQLQTLITEIFDMIMVYLDMRDRSSLARCSHRLQDLVSPLIWDCETQVNRAITWACLNGSLETLGRAVSPDGPLGCIRKEEERKRVCVKCQSWHHAEQDLYPHLDWPRWPLVMASESGQHAVFHELINRGFRFTDDAAGFKAQIQVVNSIMEPKNRKLLNQLLDKQPPEYLPLFSHTAERVANSCFWNALSMGRSPEAIEYLFKIGANLKTAHLVSRGKLCPITEAIAQSRPSNMHTTNALEPSSFHGGWLDTELNKILGMLVDHGAEPAGRPPPPLGHPLAPRIASRYHFPMFAAARHMAKYSSTGPARTLLDLGADPNQCAWMQVAVPMPIYAYLYFVGGFYDWHDTLSFRKAGAVRLRPIDGLRFWLNNGVTLRDGKPVHGSSNSPCPCQSLSTSSSPARATPMKTLLDFFLSLKGPLRLAYDSFYEAALFLARESDLGAEDAREILYRHYPDAGTDTMGNALLSRPVMTAMSARLRLLRSHNGLLNRFEFRDLARERFFALLDAIPNLPEGWEFDGYLLDL